MDRQQHWNGVYTTKGYSDVSWFEPLPEISLQRPGVIVGEVRVFAAL